MTSTEKINAILDTLSQEIARRKKTAEKAMQDLEAMNLTPPEQYKDANVRFGINCYVAGYLSHIKAEAEKANDIKKIENILRFHAYQQREKGSLDDGRDTSIGQGAVAIFLDRYVMQYFEA